MANYIGGLNRLTIDGKPYPVDGSCEVNPQSRSTMMVAGSDGTLAQKSEAMAPSIEATLRDYGSLPLPWLLQQKNLTVQVSSNNGRMWTLRGAFVDGEVKQSMVDNTLPIKFTGTEIVQSEGEGFQ